MKTRNCRPRGRLDTIFLIVTAMLIASIPGTAAQAEPDDATHTDARVVLITGANRGIGLELARQYAAAGWQVIGTARRPSDAHALRESGADVLQLDVTDQESVARLAGELEGRPIDLLINNAGLMRLTWTLEEIDFDQFNQQLAVNAVGPVRVTKALLPNLRDGKLKTIVNVTSNLGSIGDNADGGFYGYRESKAALNMFTKSLAADLGPEGFTCIVLHPGWVQTDMGGSSAPVEVQDSVAGIQRVIDSLSHADNGTFWTFEGKQMPW
jgi:NAD(P)-dependent dehydrogenase (short-subunit alcohol dehydrogenase family)